jgi:hypothetical protein
MANSRGHDADAICYRNDDSTVSSCILFSFFGRAAGYKTLLGNVEEKRSAEEW